MKKIFTTDYYPHFFLRLNGLFFLFILSSIPVGIYFNGWAGVVVFVYSAYLIRSDIQQNEIEIIDIEFENDKFNITYVYYNKPIILNIDKNAIKIQLEMYTSGRSICYRMSIFNGKFRQLIQYDNSPWDKDRFQKIISQVEEIKKGIPETETKN